MRTTLTIDDDVLEQARLAAQRMRVPFRRVVNEALRAGLKFVEEPATARPYQTRSRRMGLREGVNLDNIQELIARVEGEDQR